MRSQRLTVVAVAALLACLAAEVLAQRPPPFSPGSPLKQPEPSTSKPTPVGTSFKLGALLPLNGPGAWFGAEIKQGLELAAAELVPTPKPSVPSNMGSTSASGVAPSDGGTSADPGTEGSLPPDRAEPPATAGATTAGTSRASSPAASGASTTGRSFPDREVSPTVPGGSSAGTSSADQGGWAGETGSLAASPETKKPGSPAAEGVESPDQLREVTLVIQAADVQPLDVRDAEAEAVKLLGSGVVAIVTASPTPTLAVYPLASGRDVLVLHAGLATERFPPTSRTLFQLRPTVAARADVMSAHAWQRGLRRLAVVSGGDAFGRAVRGTVSAHWRQAGGQLVHDESVSLDASDLRSRLRAASRTGPEAVLLGYQGAALGEAARALRSAGYTGQILAVDDDRAALLAGGTALDGALILSDAFVPVPGTRGARFAKAYEARTGRPPSRFAASAYDAATLLAAAAERAVRGGRGITGSRLRDILVKERTFPSLYGGDLVVRDDGTIGRPLALFKVDDGKLAFQSYVGLDGVALAAPKEAAP